MFNDSIADLLTRIRNAGTARRSHMFDALLQDEGAGGPHFAG